ncbi:MAG: glycosyltransferase family 39 protein [Patescibacteria group bacterium]
MTNISSLKFALFLLSVALLLAASLFSLTGKPPVWFDEGIFLHAGRTLADEGVFGIQVAPGRFEDLSLVTSGYPLLVPLALVVKFFGPSIFSARLMMMFFILGFAALFFLLAKRLYGTYPALASALLLASFAPLYGNGKSVLGEVPGLFYFMAGLLFLHRIETGQAGVDSARKRYLYSLLAGVGFGLAASTKPLFLLVAGGVFAAVVVRFQFWKRHLREFLNVGIGAAITLAVWAGTQFGGSVSIERVLSFYANPYVLAAGTITTVIKTNALRFFTESTPIHFAFLFVLCVIFFVSRFRRRERVYSSEVAILVFILLVLAAYLRTPGWYRYFFTAHVMLFLFLPPVLTRIGEFIHSRFRLSTGRLAVVVLALLFVVQLGHFIKNEYRYESDTTEPARIHLAAIPPKKSIMFYNAAELAYLYPRKNFSQYLFFNEGFEVGKESKDKLASGAFDVLVVPGANLAEVSGGCYALEYTARSYIFLTKDPGRCPEAGSL